MSDLLPVFRELLAPFQPEIIALARKLIQTPSVNGADDEIAAAQVIHAWAQDQHLQSHIVGIDARRPNVIVQVGEGEPGLLLTGHLDTVPAGDPSRWTYPPFEGVTAHGKLYGRGAIDTKGGMAAALIALAVLKQWGGLRGSARFIGVPDEESGAIGTLGIKWLHTNGLLKGKGAIYCYGGREVIVGHRGVYRCKITCYGESAHPGFSATQEGVIGANAVTAMARLLLLLEDRKTDYSRTRYFEKYRTMISAGTTIEGGTSPNIVPDRCTATVDMRLIPETNASEVRGWIDQAIEQVSSHHPKLRFTVDVIAQLTAAVSPEHAALFTALEESTLEATGIEPPRTAAGPANEGYLLIERGIPTVCGFGAHGANAHAPDEYVEIDSLIETALIYALTAVKLDEGVS